MAELRRHFGVVDRDGDGRIPFAEFKQLMQKTVARARPLTDDEVRTFFRLMDKDGDGFIDMHTFAEAWVRRRIRLAVVSAARPQRSDLVDKYPALARLDDGICELLADGSIRFLSRAALLAHLDAEPDWCMPRRQDLERMEAEGHSLLLPKSDAVKLVRFGNREVGVVSYGWNSAGPPLARWPRPSR